jgi:peroxiredoxin
MKNYGNLIRFTTLFLLMAISACAHSSPNHSRKQKVPANYGYIVQPGEEVPDFSMKLADGATVSSQDWKGKVVMLQFTASWCGVCRREMPHIEKEIWQKYKDNPDFVLIGVDRDEPIDVVKRYASDMKITYPLALDPGANIFGRFADKDAGVTRNVIIGKDGKIVFMTRLFKMDEFNQMKAVIDSLLNQ